MSYLACRVTKNDRQVKCSLQQIDEQQLDDSEVIIRIEYTGINYKDALGVLGKGRIFKQFPITAGIDCAGVIESSKDVRFKPGDKVLVNGCGLGENQDGGLAEKVKVPADWVIPMPQDLNAQTAMTIGTAGFTAALAIDRMEQNDQTPELGPIVVTGASGGVGSFATSMLSTLGYEVIAITGRSQHSDYLMSLGAKQVLSFEQLELGEKPLEQARFAGVIDNVGGDLLSGLIRHIDLWGNVACIGMAADHRYSATVFPQILRGVSILGVSSANCPMSRRRRVWQRIASELVPSNIQSIIEKEVALADVLPYFEQILARKHRGRIIVNCQ